MKYSLSLLFFILTGLILRGQSGGALLEGSVSYISTQNVYVKFQSTEGIQAGDTLFGMMDGKSVPLLKVTDLSSISCVCIPIGTVKLNVGDKIISKHLNSKQEKQEEVQITPGTIVPPVVSDTSQKIVPEKRKSSQKINGNLSVASYANFSSSPGGNSQRMQYNFSLTAFHIGDSRLSAECYISFYHKLDSAGKSELKEDIFNGLKIYNLAVSYEIGKNSKILIGRKINPRISNMGAVDGLQYELKLKQFTVGALAGFRPDYSNYSFNSKLLQYGAFVSHDLQTKKGYMQSTFAFIQQNNSGNTDRMFAYLQHSNNLVKNLSFFGTVEFDIYHRTYPTDTIVHIDSSFKTNFIPKLSNIYLSLRYRVIKQLSFSISYSARNNVIYYETYKSFIDKMLELETTQGYLFQVNAQPAKKLSIGATVGYRFQQKDPRPSKNLSAYVTYAQIPGLGVSATANVIILETSYMSGKVYGVGISRDLVAGKLFASLDYKFNNFKYLNSEYKTTQNTGEVSLYWRIYKKITLSAYYEGTFEKEYNFNRVYGQFSLGF